MSTTEDTPTMLVPEGPDWQPADPGTKCRAPWCGRPAVLSLNRGLYRTGRLRPCWWRYCERHSYSRVLLDDGIYLACELEDGEA